MNIIDNTQRTHFVKNKWLAFISLPCALILVIATNGCAVLTKSQVKQVATFADVTKNYGTLPGEPIRAYGAVHTKDLLLNVSARDFSEDSARDEGWNEIKSALELDQAFKQTADRVDKALNILGKYSELLTIISSDQFSDALDKSAANLSKALDRDIKVYNENFRSPNNEEAFKPIGATVAAAVRGAGGIFIKHKQAQYVKEAVKAANPVVSDLTRDIQVLMEKQMKPLLSDLEGAYAKDFKSAAKRVGRLPLSTVESTADSVQRLSVAKALCDSAAASSKKYAEAHSELKKMAQKRRTWKGTIEEISVLAEEIGSANKLRKTLEK
jgi:hypothetical protein